MGEPLLPRFDGERGDTERFDAPIFISARRALRLLQGIARSSRDGAGETKIAQKAEGRLMKMPINFFALGVEGERVVGLFPEGEGGKGAAFGSAQGAFAHIIRGRGRKDVFCPLPPARGEVDVEGGAFGVRLPKGKSSPPLRESSASRRGGRTLSIPLCTRRAPSGSMSGTNHTLPKGTERFRCSSARSAVTHSRAWIA